MSLFSRKNEPSKEVVATKVATGARASDSNLSAVIKHPHITEKSVMQGDNHVYAFMVDKSATKFSVRAAIVALYKVTPVKVNIVNKKPSTSMSRSRGRAVSNQGYKKAYVYLKSGDTINLV